MVKQYTCETCGKVFKQKGHYINHLNRKRPCKPIENKVIEKQIQEKLQELSEKGDITIINKNLISDIETDNSIQTNMDIDTNDTEIADTEVSNTHEDIKKNRIYNENCIEYLEKLSKLGKSIDCMILDPPYFNVVDEKWDKQWKSMDDYLSWIEKIVVMLEKVAKHNCSFWIFGFPCQLSYIIPIVEKYGFKYRQHITVHKGLRAVAGRTSNKLKMFPVASEYILYFYKDSRDIIKKMLQTKQKEHNIKSSDINLKLGKAANGGGTWSTIAGKKQKNIQYPTRTD